MTDTTSITSKAAPQRLTLLPGQQLHTRPREWLRATCGAAIGLFVSVWVCQLMFGAAVATLLIGPVGASAILLFSVPSGALAQPWSICGGYLVSAVVATLVAQLGGHSLEMAALAVALSLIAMFALRCLHPPGGAVALCVVLAGPAGPSGVAADPGGGGATYILPGVAEADASSVPLVCLTSDIDQHDAGRGTLTELDQTALFAPITRSTMRPRSARELVTAIGAAFRDATTGPLGAAHVVLPYDVQLDEVAAALNAM